MKKVIIILIINFLCLHFSFGQYDYCEEQEPLVMFDIYTPMGSVVKTHLVVCEQFVWVSKKIDSLYLVEFPDTEQIILYHGVSSTEMFNCHGYAWLRVEQGIDRWIGYYDNTDTDIYMADSSYIQVPFETYPGKVFWPKENDHSAITTDQPGWLISKWGAGPLVRHRWNDHPYKEGNAGVKFYVKNCSFVIKDTVITADRNITSCGDISIKNVTISNGVTVNIRAQDSIVLKPGFNAFASVTMTAGSQMQVTPSPGYYSLPDSYNVNAHPLLEELEIKSIENTLENTGINFSVFPNPNNGNFSVEITGKISPYTVEIFNNSGKLLDYVNSKDEVVYINRPDLSAGIYYVKLTMNKKTAVKKVIIQ